MQAQQTNNKTQDRAQRRRDYLEDKAAVAAQKVAGITVMVVFGPLTILSFLWSLLGMVEDIDTRDFTHFIVPQVAIMLFCGFGAFFGSRIFRMALVWERSVEYVPPVREQISTLPADEILLRGSQALPALPKELLRPVVNQETSAEELLRASEGTESIGEA